MAGTGDRIVGLVADGEVGKGGERDHRGRAAVVLNRHLGEHRTNQRLRRLCAADPASASADIYLAQSFRACQNSGATSMTTWSSR